MNDQPTFHTRREFLRRMVLGGALSYTIPSFLANTFSALGAENAPQQTGKDSTILVVLQMAGGNDGLNTVIPYANDDYRRARPRLALADSKVLKLTDSIGLHPSLIGLRELYDSGELAIVQGVGYPNPNRSHFRSTEIWQTASDSRRFERYGWLGRYFDNACAGSDPTVGISVGRQTPQSFTCRTSKGVSLENPLSFRFDPGPHAAHETEEIVMSVRKLNQPESINSGGSINSLEGKVTQEGSALDFVQRTALDAQVSSDRIQSIAGRAANQVSYPASALGNSLKLVSRLIAGNMATRVYYVSQGGYDTHTNQLPTQERLLRDLGASMKAFTQDLKAQGNAERVVLLTFSEFGRRVAENANGGTDHGAAAPMFVAGGRVHPGLLGTYPSLARGDLFQGDLRYTVDFRSVYATLLESWLKTSAKPVLGTDFPTLDLLKT